MPVTSASQLTSHGDRRGISFVGYSSVSSNQFGNFKFCLSKLVQELQGVLKEGLWGIMGLYANFRNVITYHMSNTMNQ